jgi:ATP-dependent Clp protease adaptor protein ClpS
MPRSLFPVHLSATAPWTSAGRPGTETAPVVEREATVIPRYKVLLHNDDVNSMEHVVKALQRVFKFGIEECMRIMLEAHDEGVALCTVEPLEQAELHRDQLLSFSLVATIEPE